MNGRRNGTNSRWTPPGSSAPLTNLFLDQLLDSAPAYVVTVSSKAQAMGRIDFDDLQRTRSYSGARAYTRADKWLRSLTGPETVDRLRPKEVMRGPAG